LSTALSFQAGGRIETNVCTIARLEMPTKLISFCALDCNARRAISCFEVVHQHPVLAVLA
jgi:hypothetical protein